MPVPYPQGLVLTSHTCLTLLLEGIIWNMRFCLLHVPQYHLTTPEPTFVVIGEGSSCIYLHVCTIMQNKAVGVWCICACICACVYIRVCMYVHVCMYNPVYCLYRLYIGHTPLAPSVVGQSELCVWAVCKNDISNVCICVCLCVLCVLAAQTSEFYDPFSCVIK